MASKFYYHVYVSSAAKKLSSEELLKLLIYFRSKNVVQEITGLLLHKDGNFMQVLEGPEHQVRKLIEKIKLDPRHRGFITLIEGHTVERQFAEWTMGFRELNSSDAKAVPGYNEFLNVALTGDEFGSDPTRCQRLLLSFRKTTSNVRH